MQTSLSQSPALSKAKAKVRLSFARPTKETSPDSTGNGAVGPHPTEIIQDLSTVVADGRYLWLGSDEFTCVERLTRQDDGSFGEHRRFELNGIFDLPEVSDEEIDIEGLDVDGDYLWVIGSHSAKREKPDPEDDSVEEIIKKLSRVKKDANRYLLGRVPLASMRSKTGPEPVASLDKKADGKDKTLKAAALDLDSKTAPLIRLLSEDKHLKRFMKIPSKENGFDIEGMVVSGDRVWLGLRGPVLRGWAVVIELKLKLTKLGKLKPAKLTDDGERYRKHFLALAGLGIRSLTRDGDDILVLSGPTMDVDGPSRLHRWSNALKGNDSQVLTLDDLPILVRLPYGKEVDHAEGATLLKNGKGTNDVLVVYDSPAVSRIKNQGQSVDADLFSLPG